MYVLIALLFAVPAVAYDQRDGSNGVPFLKPDPSLKTTDPFYGGQPANQPADSMLAPIFGGAASGQVSASPLPPVFGGSAPVTDEWMNLSKHNEKISTEPITITAANMDAVPAKYANNNTVAWGTEQWL